MLNSAKAEVSSNPEETVLEFHDLLIEIMKEENYLSRFSKVNPAIDKLFAVDTISRISLGRRAWKALGAEDKDRFQNIMQKLIASTYGSRFKSFNQQKFEILDTRDLRKGRVAIRTQLFTRSETVSLEYHLQPVESKWKIYDIIANGVSDLSLKRAAYSKNYAEGGLENVVQEILQNIKKNETTSD
ncbi:MAG: hypothetical protein CMQ40_10110 [Gammaproteobacteria bacterium]|nr:hypothetical protein [Gammaproteobacteria bacterium]|tara:strand:- start:268 stop:825 length:558 start_codon:yes stop_codon:yes gene_type:complete